MKILKKVLIVIAIVIIETVTLGDNNYISTVVSAQVSSTHPVKISLLSKNIGIDDYLKLLRENFEDIQKRNEGKVVFSFYDAQLNLATQNAQLDKVLFEGTDLILLDMIDVYQVNEVINKIAKFQIPVIVFNREPFTLDPIKSYKKSLYVGTDSKQAGIVQGKIIVDNWNKHKDSIDKNKDNVLQYILLSGEKNNKTAVDRSKYSILTIQQAGIKTDELTPVALYWDTELARNTVNALFLRFGGKIEAIIANNDSMAIGAIQALQKYGFNSGDKSKLIPVVGVDGTPYAVELISKGFMLGTALLDPRAYAEAVYTIGLNLVYNRNPLEGTPYNLDETGAAVYLPFKEYTGPMFE